MTKSKITKKALLASALSLILCFTMLLGTTFAWFTDSVTSTGNIIQSGKLDVTMEWADGTKAVPADDSSDWTDASAGAIFNYNKWEPGYIAVRHIKIANEGTLALKYQLNIIANGEVSELADVIDVYYIDPATQIVDRTALAADKKLGTLTQVLANVNTTASGNLKADEKHSVTLALKMQESAGNHYQDMSIGSDFSIQLLATQLTSENDSFNDQYDAGASFDDVIFALGGTYNMDAARDEGINISPDANVIINGNDNVINVAGRGFQNSGNATVNNVEMTAGTAAIYSNATIGADAKTTYNEVTVNSAGGGISAADGAEVIFNSGSVDVNSTSTSGRYLFYAEGEGTVITINDGNFDFNKTQNQKRAYICAIDGATVYVTGGTFGKASTRNDAVFTSNDSKYSDGIITNESGTVVITGGTFGFDPSRWVADGYESVKNVDGTWSVADLDSKVVNIYGIELDITNADKCVTRVDSKEDLLNLTKLRDNWAKLFSNGQGTNIGSYYTNNGGKGYEYYYDTWTIELNADIDFGGAQIDPIKVSWWRGFDGKGHTIKNAKIATDGDAGLFDTYNGIKNLKLDNIQVTGSMVSGSVGVLAGGCNGSIENVTITNSSATGGKYTGGVVGYGYCSITNCTLKNVTVKGSYKMGGVIGYICADTGKTHDVIGNTLTGCTVADSGFHATGKTSYVIGKVVGNYNCNGTCNNNTITNMTTSATENIGEVEAGKTVTQ